MPLIRAFLLLPLLLLLVSCGYNFADGQTASLPPEFRKLFIDRVENPAPESWLEPRIRSLLRDELSRRPWATWTDRKDATALVRIDIQSYHRQTKVTGEDDVSLQYEVSIKLSGTVVDNLSGRVIWSSGSISEEWPYEAGNDEIADNKVTELAIRRFVDRMSNNF